MDVSVSIDSSEIRESIALLRREVPRALADALNRTGFELREAEQTEVRGAFIFSGPSTERFLSRSFRFEPASPDRLAITLRTLPGARAILERQQFGATIGTEDPDVGPRHAGAFAVPNLRETKRTQRGKIPVEFLPTRLLRRRNEGRTRGYIAGRAVFLREPGQKLGRFLFALTPRAVIKPELDFFGVAERTARREFPRRAARVLEKINLRRRR